MNKFVPEFIPGRPPLVSALIKQHMVEKALGNPRRYDIFHPSAWGSCLRKIAYQFYNEQDSFLQRQESDIDLRLERVFDNGHKMHFRWQEYLTNAKILRGCWKCGKCGQVYGRESALGIFSPLQTDPNWECGCGGNTINGPALEYQEVVVCSEKEYNFKGNVDAIVDLRGSPWGQGNEYDVFVVDFKSMKDDMFSDLRQAKYEHIVQTNIYMWILDLQLAVVLYENKDNQQVKEMLVPRDDELIEKIKRQALKMVEVLRHRKLPNRPAGFTRSKFPCRYCEFQRLCYA